MPKVYSPSFSFRSALQTKQWMITFPLPFHLLMPPAPGIIYPVGHYYCTGFGLRFDAATHAGIPHLHIFCFPMNIDDLERGDHWRRESDSVEAIGARGII